jgi:non-canonical poly(A) RNA polymerase PAPD5/7
MDPHKPDNDISSGTTSAPLIAQRFSEAADTLRKTMAMVQASPPDFRDSQSILGCILGGNYEVFTSQRTLMDQLDKYYMSLRR